MGHPCCCSQANQCLDDNSPGTLSSKIMDTIDVARDGSSVLLVVRWVPVRIELSSFQRPNRRRLRDVL